MQEVALRGASVAFVVEGMVFVVHRGQHSIAEAKDSHFGNLVVESAEHSTAEHRQGLVASSAADGSTRPIVLVASARFALVSLTGICGLLS